MGLMKDLKGFLKLTEKTGVSNFGFWVSFTPQQHKVFKVLEIFPFATQTGKRIWMPDWIIFLTY